jgi:protein-tyrosine phosphatase
MRRADVGVEDAEPSDPEAASADRFVVVFVCTGNRFRSQLAASLFERATWGLPVEARSAGTLDVGSLPPLPEALEEGLRLGVDLADRRSRQVDRTLLADADLVVGFERLHVDTAVLEHGAPPEHVFTLPELTALLEEGGRDGAAGLGPVARGRMLVSRAHAMRARLAGAYELADPIGQSPSVYRMTADQVATLTLRLADLLFLSVDG